MPIDDSANKKSPLKSELNIAREITRRHRDASCCGQVGQAYMKNSTYMRTPLSIKRLRRGHAAGRAKLLQRNAQIIIVTQPL